MSRGTIPRSTDPTFRTTPNTPATTIRVLAFPPPPISYRALNTSMTPFASTSTATPTRPRPSSVHALANVHRLTPSSNTVCPLHSAPFSHSTLTAPRSIVNKSGRNASSTAAGSCMNIPLNDGSTARS
eukprot:31311-Pelagococcus_subviridis.AAC.9